MNRSLKAITNRLTNKATAELLGVSPSTVSRWKNKGIPTKRAEGVEDTWQSLRAKGVKPAKSVKAKQLNARTIQKEEKITQKGLPDNVTFKEEIRPAKTSTVQSPRYVYTVETTLGTFGQTDFDAVVQDTQDRSDRVGDVAIYAIVTMNDGEGHQTPLNQDMETFSFQLDQLADKYEIDPFEIDTIELVTQSRVRA